MSLSGPMPSSTSWHSTLRTRMCGGRGAWPQSLAQVKKDLRQIAHMGGGRFHVFDGQSCFGNKATDGSRFAVMDVLSRVLQARPVTTSSSSPMRFCVCARRWSLLRRSGSKLLNSRGRCGRRAT